MDEDRIGVRVDGGLDQRAAGGNPGDDLAHHRAAFDLQAVRSVVLESRRGQQQVERVQKFVACRTHRSIVAAAGAQGLRENVFLS